MMKALLPHAARPPTAALGVTLCLTLAACGGPGAADGGDRGSGAGSCPSQQTPAGLVDNAGFECGLRGWFAREGQLELATAGHSGAAAATLVVPAGGVATLTTEQSLVGLHAGTYCGTVWVKGTAPSAVFTLRKVSGTAVVDDTFTDTVSASSWARLPPTLVLDFDGAGVTQLLVLVQTKLAHPGDTLQVDDLDVWPSAAGDCHEHR